MHIINAPSEWLEYIGQSIQTKNNLKRNVARLVSVDMQLARCVVGSSLMGSARRPDRGLGEGHHNEFYE